MIFKQGFYDPSRPTCVHQGSLSTSLICTPMESSMTLGEIATTLGTSSFQIEPKLLGSLALVVVSSFSCSSLSFTLATISSSKQLGGKTHDETPLGVREPAKSKRTTTEQYPCQDGSLIVIPQFDDFSIEKERKKRKGNTKLRSLGHQVERGQRLHSRGGFVGLHSGAMQSDECGTNG